jgi:CheY-like chemotaxis protein
MNKHILVIDDDAGIRLFLQKVLEGAGYSVSTAEEGQAGIQSAWDHRPDVVITDMVMPVNDGYRTIEMFRTDPEMSVPIIVISGAVAPYRAQEILDAGASAFFTKPINTAALLTRISELLG